VNYSLTLCSSQGASRPMRTRQGLSLESWISCLSAEADRTKPD
jgi:hypothetical protein